MPYNYDVMPRTLLSEERHKPTAYEEEKHYMAMYVRNGGTLARRPADTFVPLRQAVDRLFQDSFPLPSPLTYYRGGAAGTNLYQTEDGFVVQIALPGAKADSINLSVEKDVVTVSAEAAVQAPEKATTVWQSFGGQRDLKIQLPAEVDSGAVTASYEAGVLTVQLPKAAHMRPRTIKVNASYSALTTHQGRSQIWRGGFETRPAVVFWPKSRCVDHAAQHRVPRRLRRQHAETGVVEVRRLDLIGRDGIEHVAVGDGVERLDGSRH